MTWWEILASVVYGAGYAVAVRLLGGHAAYVEAEDWGHPGTVDLGNWTLGLCKAACVGWAWPLFLALRLAYRHLGLRVSVKRFAIGAEKDALEQAHRERIRELEQEAGIR